MTTIDEIDEFANWDKTGDAVGNALRQDNTWAGLATGPNHDNIDLVLEDVSEDNSSFYALQHSPEDKFPLGDIPAPMDTEMETTIDFHWETPDSPCANSALGGFSCTRICEGKYEGYCPSCASFRVECCSGTVVPESFNPKTTNFPANRWPATGPRPKTTVLEDFRDEPLHLLRSTSGIDLAGLTTQSIDDAFPKPGPPPKIGARFSGEPVRILKNWLSTHHRHPYPSEEEKEMLRRQTGLNKAQITNWLANARRRGKVQAPRSTSPHLSTWSGPIDIPQRRGTPAVKAMNPLQRWEHSPLEHELASATAIARAVTASSSGRSSGLNSPHSFNYTDDGSGKSLNDQSSASSLGTSHSSGASLNSAYSYRSAPFNNRVYRRRRRRTGAKPSDDGNTNLSALLKIFQCTFCVETFRTKHDWQRHEKSLHISLERWVCSPHGPRVINPENGQLSCVFCGLANPHDAHIECHNYSACQDRAPVKRTFYRKDHLNQHLRLVHNIKFMDRFMKSWKTASPKIQSRCGFCGIMMGTWTIRVDHLAEHFKTGYSMTNWKGDWGFKASVLKMIQNSIPPYLSHHEQTSPIPYIVSLYPPETPRNAFKKEPPFAEVISTSENSPAFFFQRSNQSTGSGPFTKSTTKSLNCPVNQDCTSPPASCQNNAILGPFYLNNSNCYGRLAGRLAKELGRYVALTISPNNPNQHVPSDVELQHQARWILYDDDGPWNQTAADNAEWL
ncbi:hypothetical protein EDB80DRAFT_656524 [Ilyonectria destructans]|nr:hypothetical protein EDB80DRAFT_656524 [Ilyonectria destructans]